MIATGGVLKQKKSRVAIALYKFSNGHFTLASRSQNRVPEDHGEIFALLRVGTIFICRYHPILHSITQFEIYEATATKIDKRIISLC